MTDVSSPKAFTGPDGGVPFPRSAKEWENKGYSPEQAEQRMRNEVFGHDHKADAKGNPIEQGKGSAAQQTHQHLQAMHIAETAAAARGMRLGYSPAIEGAFDPRIQDQIDRAVAAALRKAKPATRRAKKAKPADPVAN